MVKIDDLIGDVIFISFRDRDRMKDIGIKETSGHYLLAGYDQLGLWLDHPGITIQHMEDEKGNPLPAAKQYHEEIDAIFMVHWDNVSSMMYYPNRKGFDFPDQFKKKIGFRFKNQQKTVVE